MSTQNRLKNGKTDIPANDASIATFHKKTENFLGLFWLAT